MNEFLTIGVIVTVIIIGAQLFKTSGDNNFLAEDCTVSQVRIALGDNYSPLGDRRRNNDVTISFHTPSKCQTSKILITQNNQISQILNQEIVHSVLVNEHWCHKAKYCETVNYDQYVHHFYANLNSLGAFKYTIITDLSQTGPFEASVPAKVSSAKQQKFLYFGDLDNSAIATDTWNLLKTLKQTDQIEATVFLGDIAYEFYQNNGKQGDLFMQTLQPYISHVPWLMTAGNHEDNGNYTFFNDKFRSPNYEYSNNHYYSVDIGLVHFISLNLHFYNDGDGSLVQSQAVLQKLEKWVEADLIKANSNRNAVPWIVVFGHKGVYCVSSECNDYSTFYKVFDDLFYNYGVDLFLGAHKHEYQFLKPVHHDKILNYTESNGTIINPAGTIYVVQGNGGNRNMMDSLNATHKEYLIHNNGEPGLGRLTVFDKYEIQLEFIQASNQKVVDVRRIQKSVHQPY